MIGAKSALGKVKKRILAYEEKSNGKLKLKIDGKLEVKDKTTLSDVKIKGNLKVDGQTTLNCVNVGSIVADRIVTNSETVNGPLTANGGLTVRGGEIVDTLNVTGDLTADGPVAANDGLTVLGGETVDTLSVTGDLTVGGQVGPATQNVTFQLFDGEGFSVDNTQSTTTVKIRKIGDQVMLYFPTINLQAGQTSSFDGYGNTVPPSAVFWRSVDGFLPPQYCPSTMVYNTSLAASSDGITTPYSVANIFFNGNMEPSTYVGSIDVTSFMGYIDPVGYYLYVVGPISGSGLFLDRPYSPPLQTYHLVRLSLVLNLSDQTPTSSM